MPYSSLDISGIYIKRATTEEELQQVFDLRWEGYHKYFNSRQELVDDLDFGPNVTLLLAKDAQNQALGTMRILDQRIGQIELEKFMDINLLLTDAEIPCAEATRFSIPIHPRSLDLKLALCKGFYLYCTHHGIKTALISVRSSATRDYNRLLFEDTGPNGIYSHTMLGNILHYTYKLNITQAAHIYKTTQHPLYDFFCVKEHPDIRVD